MKSHRSVVLSFFVVCMVCISANGQVLIDQPEEERPAAPSAAIKPAQRAPYIPRENFANPDILEVNRSLSLFYRYSHMYYIEPSGVNAFNTLTGYEDYEYGSLNGGGIGLSWMSDALWYMHAEWSGATGKVGYTGFFQGGGAAYGISHATVQDYNLKFGKGFAAGQQWMFTPYLSFGGRYWVRELGVGTIGDFVESYSHYYLALGGMMQYSPFEKFVVTADGAVGRTFYPTINVPPFGLNNTPLGPGPVIKLGLDADYRVISALHVFAGFDYLYFNYGQSGIQDLGGGFGVLEPFSHTEMYTATAGIRISFNENELFNFR